MNPGTIQKNILLEPLNFSRTCFPESPCTYLSVHHWQHDEGEEVLGAEDEDGEGVLHVGVRPHLHAQGLHGPGQVHSLQGLGRGSIRGASKIVISRRPESYVFTL